MIASDDRHGSTSVEERYRALLETGRTLAGTLAPEELYAAIYRETARALETSGFYVALYDQVRDLAEIVFFASEGAQKTVDVAYRGSDSEVIRTRKGSRSRSDLTDDAILSTAADTYSGIQSALSAPMIHHGRVIGSLSALSRRPDAYAEDDLDLLQGIADIAAVAIDNAQQFAELARRRREAEQVEEIGRTITSELNSKHVLGKVIQAVHEVLGIDGAAVWLAETPGSGAGRFAESGGEVKVPVGVSWDLVGELEATLIQEGNPVVIDDLAASNLIPRHLRDHLKAGSASGVPIRVGGLVAGVLAAGSRHPRRFGPDETAVLQRLANQCAVALENARLHESLQALSLTDPLTGLPNRRRLQIHLEKEIAAARRGRPLSLVIYDIDNFKKYNDTYGHLVGDDILRAFADILLEENREMNLVARYGGDEFVSVLSDSLLDGTQMFKDRVFDRVRSDPILAKYGVGVSIGVATFDRSSMNTMEDILQQADLDMYMVKSQRHAAAKRTSP